MSEEIRPLALHARHAALGATFAPFAGFNMPMQYTSIKEEHVAVRERVGLFDVSHMGEIEVRGADALEVVNRIVTNDVSRLEIGQALYTVMCHEDGGIVDDLLVYRMAEEHIFLCVNAANRDKDLAHILKYAQGDSEITHTSDDFVQLALQGPQALSMLDPLCSLELTQMKYFWSATGEIAGHECLISRTGYTGEDGFELYIPVGSGEAIFDAIVEAGASYEMAMCGLGCRDTLRLEAKLHLYGQDMDDTTHPYEAGLSWVVKLDKGEFVGKEALARLKVEGVRRRLRGLIVQDKGVIRPGYDILVGDEVVGKVTSGSYSITLDTSIGLGYIEIDHVDRDVVDVAVRRRALNARVTKKPFYKR